MTQADYRDMMKQAGKYLDYQKDLFGEELFLENPDIFQGNQHSHSFGTLNELKEAIQDCQKCPLSETRTHLVFGCGNEHANLILIGEAPGRDEDLQGEPFVGRAGQLLDKILAAIGFQRKEIYIGNILKCRPPNNRDPLPEEIALCMPHLMKQIDIIQPKIILALGRISAQTLLKTSASLGQLRSETLDFKGIPLMVTYHPAALLRNPHWKQPVWEDVQRLRNLYDEIVGDKPKWQPTKK
ncbi:uracil-DNA glycosylase [bacterium]|nr:uracil-DNA glycosylase [bacterium]